MESSQVILWMIVGCVFFVFLVAFEPFKKLLRVFARAAVGCIGFWGVNLLLAPLGIGVGINLLTAFIVGVLGIPGFVLLYAVQYIS